MKIPSDRIKEIILMGEKSYRTKNGGFIPHQNMSWQSRIEYKINAIIFYLDEKSKSSKDIK